MGSFFIILLGIIFIITMMSHLTIFSWNCQGFASSKFSRTFHEYNIEHKPDIVCLLERLISGKNANFVIEN